MILGRSDAVLNPGGVRIGTAEIYRQVEQLDEVQESVVVGQESGNDVRVILFVRLRDGLVLDDALRERIRKRIREHATPRHVPAKILQVPEIPRTISGKVVELAVREAIHGRPVKNTDALANPAALDHFRDRPELARLNSTAEKSPLTARIEAALAAQGHALDAPQRAALLRLEDLRRRVLARNTCSHGGLDLLPRARTPLRGLYLWGGVGRGKTFLVDEFFAELPVREKRREHFHRLMQDVHARLRRHRNRPSPLEQVASDIASKSRVLCIDEFIVGDVADAMILGTLLEALFRRGVTLVATSNLPPAALYRDGLQRERFLPAIALHREALPRHGARRGRRLSPAPARTRDAVFRAGNRRRRVRMAAEFERLADGAGERDVKVQVAGRSLRARREAEDVVWFDFRELCEGPRRLRTTSRSRAATRRCSSAACPSWTRAPTTRRAAS